MSTYYIIYETTNQINGKKYRGMHSTSNLEDSYLGSGKHLQAALKKYGENNFTRIILFFANSYQSMVAIEKELITKEWCDRSDTYNIRTGGIGGWNDINQNSDLQRAKALKSNQKQQELRKDEIWVAKKAKACSQNNARKAPQMFTDEQIIIALEGSKSIREAMRKLGAAETGGTYRRAVKLGGRSRSRSQTHY